MTVHKVAVPPGVALRMCEDCREKEDDYMILKKNVKEDCQHLFCENRDRKQTSEE